MEWGQQGYGPTRYASLGGADRGEVTGGEITTAPPPPGCTPQYFMVVEGRRYYICKASQEEGEGQARRRRGALEHSHAIPFYHPRGHLLHNPLAHHIRRPLGHRPQHLGLLNHRLHRHQPHHPHHPSYDAAYGGVGLFGRRRRSVRDYEENEEDEEHEEDTVDVMGKHDQGFQSRRRRSPQLPLVPLVPWWLAGAPLARAVGPLWQPTWPRRGSKFSSSLAYSPLLSHIYRPLFASTAPAAPPRARKGARGPGCVPEPVHTIQGVTYYRCRGAPPLLHLLQHPGQHPQLFAFIPEV